MKCACLDLSSERDDARPGKGNFNAAMHALECYYAAGFEPTELVTLTTVGLPDLDSFCLIKQKMRRINLNCFRAIWRAGGHCAWMVNPEYVSAIARECLSNTG